MFRPGLWTAALALGAALCAASPARADVATPKLFGTTEIRSNNLRPFPKWTDMLTRHRGEEERGDGACTPTPFNRCPVQKWKEFIESERGHDRREQVDEVNRHLNLHRYVLDIVNYGTEDYWATPREFALKDGDCEDFAIAKYVTLKMLGWSDDDLRVVVLQDLNLKVAHAVLAVYLGGEVLILDNQAKQVVPAQAIHHYRPYYSVNESGWWLHKP